MAYKNLNFLLGMEIKMSFFKTVYEVKSLNNIGNKVMNLNGWKRLLLWSFEVIHLFSAIIMNVYRWPIPGIFAKTPYPRWPKSKGPEVVFYLGIPDLSPLISGPIYTSQRPHRYLLNQTLVLITVFKLSRLGTEYKMFEGSS